MSVLDPDPAEGWARTSYSWPSVPLDIKTFFSPDAATSSFKALDTLAFCLRDEYRCTMSDSIDDRREFYEDDCGPDRCNHIKSKLDKVNAFRTKIAAIIEAELPWLHGHKDIALLSIDEQIRLQNEYEDAVTAKWRAEAALADAEREVQEKAEELENMTHQAIRSSNDAFNLRSSEASLKLECKRLTLLVAQSDAQRHRLLANTERAYAHMKKQSVHWACETQKLKDAQAKANRYKTERDTAWVERDVFQASVDRLKATRGAAVTIGDLTSQVEYWKGQSEHWQATNVRTEAAWKRSEEELRGYLMTAESHVIEQLERNDALANEVAELTSELERSVIISNGESSSSEEESEFVRVAPASSDC